MGHPFSELRWPRWLTWVVALCALLLLYQLSVRLLGQAVGLVRPVLGPLLVALAISYLLEPLVEWLERRLHWSRRRAAFASVASALLVFLFLLTVLLPPIVAQLIVSAERVPEVLRSAASALEPLTERLQQRYPAIYSNVVQRITEYLRDPAHVTNPVFNSVTGALKRAADIGSNLLNAVLIPLFIYYILADFVRLRELTESLVPIRYRHQVFDLIGRIDRVTSTFVRGQLIVASILSALYVTGFLIVGVNLPLSLGLLAGLGYLVPYVGTLVAVVLTGLFTLLNNPSLLSVLGIAGVYMAVQFLEGFVITPRLLGGRLRLHPMLVIVGLIVGGSSFGILGIVLAMPVLAIIKVVFSSLVEPYRNSPFFSRERDELIQGMRNL